MRTIRKKGDFQKVFRDGITRKYGNFLAVYLKGGSGEPAFGFSVTKRLGGSVVRNRIRRRLREAVRVKEKEFPPGIYVFLARKKAIESDFRELQSELERFREEIVRAER